MQHGFISVAAASHAVAVGDPVANAQQLATIICQHARDGARIIVTPELGLCGYTAGDLLLQDKLLASVRDALGNVLQQTASCDALCAVGLPLSVGGKLYNCAAVFIHGMLLGVVAKKHLPTYSEFNEGRYFTPAPDCAQTITLCGQKCLFGGMQVFRCANMPGLAVGVEICEDLWVPHAPHATLAQAGATVLCNLSASNQLVSKSVYRRMLVTSAGARQLAGYVYCDASWHESTQDVVFSANNIIAETGYILAESKPFGAAYATAQIDVQRLLHERRKRSSFDTCTDNVSFVDFSFTTLSVTRLTRTVESLPFVPQDNAARQERVDEVLQLQAHGLAGRWSHVHADKLVLGVSGGLDSTLALLVCVEACRLLHRPVDDIVAITMPCFGTSTRTKGNADKLCEALGISCRTIDIKDSVTLHLQSIGHDSEKRDITYENAQARTRTLVLMDIANQTNGIVVGTGDLSELALGWCTYNGDQMSMYNVNASVPKTLIQAMITICAQRCQDSNPALSRVLTDIVATPISPELLPTEQGVIAQKTEESVGPYDINDFILFYAVRWGFSPAKIARLMAIAFPSLDDQQIKLRLRNFFRRFFSQQFKRSSGPDGPMIGTVCLSRGSWRMPSDAHAAAWLAEIDNL